MFERVEMNRVEAYHDVLNPASGRVMLKSGMRHEGVKRQARFHHRRGFFDLSIYGILRSDYYGA
jgi:ribosomal-protein-alanine N-acetyltransferase